MASVVRDTVDAAAGGLRFSTKTTCGGDGGLKVPFNDRISERVAEVRAEFEWAALEISRVPYAPAPRGLVECAAFIADHIGWIITSPDAWEWIGWLNTQSARLAQVVDRPADRHLVGMCGEAKPDMSICQARLYALDGQTEVRCRECGWVHQVGTRRQYLLSQASSMSLPPTELARAIAGVGGIEVTPKQIDNWTQRGKLKPTGKTPTGRPTYRVSDVLALLQGATRPPHLQGA